MNEDSLWLLLVVVVGVHLVVAKFFWRRRRRKNWRPDNRFRRQPHLEVVGNNDLSSPEKQLFHVQRAAFRTRPLMNWTEYQCFQVVQNWVWRHKRDGMRVFAQVPLGEILFSDDDQAFRSINAKRIDLLVIDRKGDPLIALEVQGESHYQGTAAVRDHVKRIALTKAGVPLVEVFPGEGEDEIFARLDQARPRQGGAGN